eukprot:SAG11_NODE_9071_length_947_cov_1.084906_1_plen_117_part_00
MGARSLLLCARAPVSYAGVRSRDASARLVANATQVMPMMDQSNEYGQFIREAPQSSGEATGVGSLTPRERKDAAMMLQNIVQGKPIQTFERSGVGSGSQEQEEEEKEVKAEVAAKL